MQKGVPDTFMLTKVKFYKILTYLNNNHSKQVNHYLLIVLILLTCFQVLKMFYLYQILNLNLIIAKKSGYNSLQLYLKL